MTDFGVWWLQAQLVVGDIVAMSEVENIDVRARWHHHYHAIAPVSHIALPGLTLSSRLDSPSQPAIANAPAVKIVNYNIVRNTADFVTYSIQPRVVSKDVSKLAYFTEDADTEVYVEDGCLMLTGPQKAEHTTARAFLKLPKSVQPKVVEVDKPPKGGLFVTVPKVGSTADSPPPLDGVVTGRAEQRILGPNGQDLPTSQGGLPNVPDADGVVRPWITK